MEELKWLKELSNLGATFLLGAIFIIYQMKYVSPLIKEIETRKSIMEELSGKTSRILEDTAIILQSVKIMVDNNKEIMQKLLDDLIRRK